MTWYNNALVLWHQLIYWATWNSKITNWDDNTVTWDALSDHDWQTDNTQGWYTKN